jgi:hypothetical protein
VGPLSMPTQFELNLEIYRLLAESKERVCLWLSSKRVLKVFIELFVYSIRWSRNAA